MNADLPLRMARVMAIQECIDIVQQTLDTVRGEDDGESRTIRASIGAREHIIRLLSDYRDREAVEINPSVVVAIANALAAHS